MYERKDDHGCVSSVFIRSVQNFTDFSTNKGMHMDKDRIKCQCIKFYKRPYLEPDKVKYHLYKSGFVPNY